MEAIFQDIARLRWPNYRVEGTGEIAVVLTCAQKVVLASAPMEARVIAAERCGDQCCHGRNKWHTIHLLNKPQQARKITRRARWLKFDD
jgi:hypothetical protein